MRGVLSLESLAGGEAVVDVVGDGEVSVGTIDWDNEGSVQGDFVINGYLVNTGDLSWVGVQERIWSVGSHREGQIGRCGRKGMIWGRCTGIHPSP